MSTFEQEQLLVLVLAESPLQLAWSFPPSSLTSLLTLNRLEAQADGCVLLLPDARINPVAQTARFYNTGSFAVEIKKFGGVDLLTLAAGEYYEFSLIDNSTAAGDWLVNPYIAGAVNISNFTIATGTPQSLVITNGNVTGTGQTVTMSLPDTLLGLSNPASGTLDKSGILAYNPNGGNPVYISRVLQSSDSNLVITNPNGAAGNPSFSLSPTLTGLTSVEVGTVTIDNNGITSAGTDIVLSTGNTAGNIIANGTQIDPSGNTTIGGSLQVNGGFNAPQLPIGWARMTDTTTGETNTITIQDAFNAVLTQKVAGTGGTYHCVMPVSALNTNYGVQLSCGTASINSPPLFAQVIYSSVKSNSFDFIVTDAGGTIVSEVPNSVTITIFSTGNAAGSSSGSLGGYGNMYISLPGTSPTISLTNTDTTIIPGTTEAGTLQNFTMPTSNKLVYVGVAPIKATVSAIASVFYSYLNPVENVSIRVLKNGADVLPVQYSCAGSEGKTCAIPVEVTTDLVTNDYIEIGISTDTPPLTLSVAHMNVTIRSIRT